MEEPIQQKGKILVVDDERIALKNLEHVLKKEGYEVTGTQSGAKALTVLKKQQFDVVLTDLRMKQVDGMQILTKCRSLSPPTEVVLITGYATLQSAVDAMRKGAFYYIAKPFRLEEIRKIILEAVEKVRLKRENQELREQVACLKEGKVRIITQDGGMQRLLDTARQIAPTDCNVLITGESGTGKELFAHYIHACSRRAQQPFLAVNCAAFTEELLANELFGHEKGAFTGAISAKKGLIEAATEGTLFLDEVAEMSPSMQAKLLRVIQEKEMLRLGATQPAHIDVRFVAATNRDVHDAISQGQLRQDLYFRLNVVDLHIPPLAARKDDIPLLSYFFLTKYSAIMDKRVHDIAPDVMSLLMSYAFPGNVRELENIIARGVALATEGSIEDAHLPSDLRELKVRAFRKHEGKMLSLEEQEAEYIQWVLKEVDGNKTLASEILGIDRVSLWRKLKKYKMEAEQG